MNYKGLYIFILILFFSSCQNEVIIDSVEKRKFMESEQLGYYKEGEGVLLYQEGKHQVVMNNKRHLFRLQSDSQGEYVNVKLEKAPRREGSRTVIYFDYFYAEEDASHIYLFECSKMSNEKTWFWSAETKEGIITPIL